MHTQILCLCPSYIPEFTSRKQCKVSVLFPQIMVIVTDRISTKYSHEGLRDTGSIPGSGRSVGGGHGNPLQYSHLENPTEVPGGLQSPGLPKAGHDWVTTHSTEKQREDRRKKPGLPWWFRGWNSNVAKLGSPGSIPIQGTRSHRPQLRPNAAK